MLQGFTESFQFSVWISRHFLTISCVLLLIYFVLVCIFIIIYRFHCNVLRAWCVHWHLFKPTRKWRIYALVILVVSDWKTEAYYGDVIMGTIASQITSLTIVYSTVYSGTDQRNIGGPRHWPLCGEFTDDRWFPAQRASNAEKVYIWWRHHVVLPSAHNYQNALEFSSTDVTSLVIKG